MRRRDNAVQAAHVGERRQFFHLVRERPGDVPVYLSDCTRLFSITSWRPRHGPREILADIEAWVSENEEMVGRALGFEE